MTEFRYDLVQKRWVIIAGKRAARPQDFSWSPDSVADEGSCPFCEGNEAMTPPELYALRPDGSKPDGPGWEIRVVPNRFPAVEPGGVAEQSHAGWHRMMRGVGYHEVIIETPDHHATMADLDVRQLRRIFMTYRERIVERKNESQVRYILLFKNHGGPSGASLRHPHTQLTALPLIPSLVSIEQEAFAEHYLKNRRCLMCDVMDQELRSGERVLFDDGHFVAYLPYASRFPFETWILPRKHASMFETCSDDQLGRLADTMKNTLTKLKKVLNDPPYNFILHTRPHDLAETSSPGVGESGGKDFHWHFEILPRITKVAGFEWGSGLFINSVPPEEAARFLRECE